MIPASVIKVFILYHQKSMDGIDPFLWENGSYMVGWCTLSVLWYDCYATTYFSTLFFQHSRESFRTIHVPKLVIRSFRLIFGDHPLLEIQRCPFEKKICPLSFLSTAFRTMTKSQFIILYQYGFKWNWIDIFFSISGEKNWDGNICTKLLFKKGHFLTFTLALSLPVS